MHVLEIVSMLLFVGLSMIVRPPCCRDYCIYKYRLKSRDSLAIPLHRVTGSEAKARGSPAPFRRLQRVGGVGLVPLHVARRAVDRRDRLLASQPPPRLHLRPMMAGVQDPPPAHPNPLPPQAAEEGPALQPPASRALSQLRQPSFHQPDVLVDVRPSSTIPRREANGAISRRRASARTAA